jgi:hypothetical protein
VFALQSESPELLSLVEERHAGPGKGLKDSSFTAVLGL